MRNHARLASLAVGLSLLLSGALLAEEKPAKGKGTIELRAGQKSFLSLEPILVTARLTGSEASLPAGLAKEALRIEIKPAVKARSGAKPLPLEAKGGKNTRVRTYDLAEWFQFPATGTFTIRAVLEQDGGTLTSKTVEFTISKPGKGDDEAGPVDRIHHIPWTNYDTNAFCGDTFDVVKRWPKSKLTRYCHYWNGRFSQNKKEYDKAIASYKAVVAEGPDFPLADHAAYGIAECLLAQKKPEEARKQLLTLREKVKSKGQCAVAHLVEEALRPVVGSAKK
jgi:hypothetical protein